MMQEILWLIIIVVQAASLSDVDITTISFKGRRVMV